MFDVNLSLSQVKTMSFWVYSVQSKTSQFQNMYNIADQVLIFHLFPIYYGAYDGYCPDSSAYVKRVFL